MTVLNNSMYVMFVWIGHRPRHWIKMTRGNDLSGFEWGFTVGAQMAGVSVTNIAQLARVSVGTVTQVTSALRSVRKTWITGLETVVDSVFLMFAMWVKTEEQLFLTNVKTCHDLVHQQLESEILQGCLVAVYLCKKTETGLQELCENVMWSESS